ncbi:hypothetical protein [Streptococcus phocae]|uniref:ABC transporter permease n=1 Tax=Streptococcus phocae TaxID=119224 RepID=A0A0P6SP80_9STRE|nr:hypothetical protein [Streptococcus phocae]KPJ23255.1 ABC transporter permease [Streptococcus phocae]
MFGKLLKYEFKSIGKWYLGLNVGVIVLAAILSFTLTILSESPDNNSLTGVFFNELLPLTLSLVFGVLISTSLVATLFIIINRFNKNIFGREGYLTLTLPVTSHQIILSKLFFSVLCTFFNIIILMIGIAILILPRIDSEHLHKAMTAIFKMEYLSIYAHGLAYVVFMTISGTLLIYFAISIGQLFSNNRGLKAFAAYFIIIILLNIINLYVNTDMTDFPGNDLTNMTIFLRYAIVEQLITSALFYLGTHFIIKNKLNIQ